MTCTGIPAGSHPARRMASLGSCERLDCGGPSKGGNACHGAEIHWHYRCPSCGRTRLVLRADHLRVLRAAGEALVALAVVVLLDWLGVPT